MNFEQALVALRQGYSVRCREWRELHFRLIDDELRLCLKIATLRPILHNDLLLADDYEVVEHAVRTSPLPSA